VKRKRDPYKGLFQRAKSEMYLDLDQFSAIGFSDGVGSVVDA